MLTLVSMWTRTVEVDRPPVTGDRLVWYLGKKELHGTVTAVDHWHHGQGSIDYDLDAPEGSKTSWNMRYVLKQA